MIWVWLFWLFLGFFEVFGFSLYIWFLFDKYAEKSPSCEKMVKIFAPLARYVNIFLLFKSGHEKRRDFCAVFVK